ncbi:hypothetical protein D3C81_2001390 [compost metagenome]
MQLQPGNAVIAAIQLPAEDRNGSPELTFQRNIRCQGKLGNCRACSRTPVIQPVQRQTLILQQGKACQLLRRCRLERRRVLGGLGHKP